MKRLVGLLVVAAVLVSSAPAFAASDWDPDDVDGPLDMKWIGARFIPDDRFRLTISFYDDFRPSAIPLRHGKRNSVTVTFTDFLNGFFFRRQNERIMLFYGDFGSDCCAKAPVRQPSANVLRVTFPTIHDPADLTYEVRARSTWQHEGETFRDRTGWLRLGRPPQA